MKRTSDGCKPKYPDCNEQTLAVTVAIDYSGSASHHRKAHLEQAKSFISTLYDGFVSEHAENDLPRVSKVVLQVREFTTGLGRAIWGGDGVESVLSAESLDDVLSKLSDDMDQGAAGAQLNRFTDIGKTVVEAQHDFHDSDLHAIVIISDGDGDGSDAQFNASMAIAKSAQANRCVRSWNGKSRCAPWLQNRLDSKFSMGLRR